MLNRRAVLPINVRRFALFLCAAVLTLLISSCKSEPYIEGQITHSHETTGAIHSETDGDMDHGDDPTDEITVYWVDKGSVYHFDTACSYLAKSTEIRSGAVSKCPISRACDRCKPAAATPVESSGDTSPPESSDRTSLFETDTSGGVQTTLSTDTITAIDTTAAPDTTNSPDTAVYIDGSTVVYYTSGGSVYHINAACSSLKNSANVLHSELSACPKGRACSICSKYVVILPSDGQTSTPPETAINSENEATVYYLASGGVYHLYEDCYHITGKTIISCPLFECPKQSLCATCAAKK